MHLTPWFPEDLILDLWTKRIAIERLHEEAELFDPEILKAFTRAYEDGSLTLKTSTKSEKVLII